MKAAPSEEKLLKILEILDRYDRQPSKLIPILQDVQKAYQYLPEDLLAYVAASLEIPAARVYGVATFYKIPYVAPPVGPLRWQPPVAHAPWAGVRNATAPGDVCIQGDKLPPGTPMSEDCLFMNIATPITALSSPTKLPVMVCESLQRAPLHLRSPLTCAGQGSTAAGTRRARAASTAARASWGPLRCASSWSRSTTA